ncbi:60S ribosomal protein L28 [Echinococcus multilocularis]|uniref:60S ribosomal protein L28 n=1 Tax=Echinococcus multilocularis TaxID=6211 RepID=A0A0S4MM35_ECHMU|nr:60S ribosomal protein L28 [Echinococcus multilocularis]
MQGSHNLRMTRFNAIIHRKLVGGCYLRDTEGAVTYLRRWGSQPTDSIEKAKMTVDHLSLGRTTLSL